MTMVQHSLLPVKAPGTHMGAAIANELNIPVDDDPEPESLQARYERLLAAYNRLVKVCDLLQTPCKNCPCLQDRRPE